jgi:hypothetical protein
MSLDVDRDAVDVDATVLVPAHAPAKQSRASVRRRWVDFIVAESVVMT